MLALPEPLEFNWDKGNSDKNFKKHRVANKEAEEVFLNNSKFIFKDDKHSIVERRCMIWGTTNKKRRLSIFFTIRQNKVRIISARDMHRKERREYEKKIKTNTAL